MSNIYVIVSEARKEITEYCNKANITEPVVTSPPEGDKTESLPVALPPSPPEVDKTESLPVAPSPKGDKTESPPGQQH